MADITLCANAKDGCKWKEKCYRFTAKPSDQQSYANFYKEGTHCMEFFMRGFGRENERA